MSETKKRPGRPQVEIDWDKVDKYLQAQCDGSAIAEIIGIHPDTLYRCCERDNNIGFSAYSATKRAAGREILRAKQFQSAMAGNVTMMIWLGKQYLGQKDRNEVTNTGLPELQIVVDSSETAQILKDLLKDGDPTDERISPER